MDVFYLENKKELLLKKILREKSFRKKVNIINPFIEELLGIEEKNTALPFLLEILPYYFNSLEKYNISGIELEHGKKLLATLKKTFQLKEIRNTFNQKYSLLNKMERELSDLQKSLLGEYDGFGKEDQNVFPVLEDNLEINSIYGQLEELTVSINIRESLTKDKIVVIPTATEKDILFEYQIKNSWTVAKKIFAKYKLIKNGCHEIIIEFTNSNAIYKGNSLGITVTIGLLKSLFRTYNLRYKIGFFPLIASTGSVNEKGTIAPVSDKIIRKKVSTVFFSKINKFIISQKDLPFAIDQLENMLSRYPKRNLQIFAVDSVEDLINRRNLISFEKQNLIKWTTQRVVKEKYAIIPAVILLFFIGFFFLREVDNNPHSLDQKPGFVNVYNKFGKTLFSMSTNNSSNNGTLSMMTDYDNDNINEVVICKERADKDKSNVKKGRVALLNSSGEDIWDYTFRETVETKFERFDSLYNVNSIIGTYNEGSRKILVCSGSHKYYWPSPIFKIDLETGKRVGKIFWHPGTVFSGRIFDFNNDGQVELLAFAINNEHNSVALFKIDINELSGTLIGSDEYTILNKEEARINKYILIPKTDYRTYFSGRYNVPDGAPTIMGEDKKIFISIREDGPTDKNMEASYRIVTDYSLAKYEIIIPSYFRINRDKLVSNGQLNRPFTDTQEYRDILKNQIKVLFK